MDNHYWRTFGGATLLSILSAGAQLSQPETQGSNTTEASEQLSAELGRNWSETSQQVVERNLNVQPTLTIRAGFRFNVMVNQDLILAPYQQQEEQVSWQYR